MKMLNAQEAVKALMETGLTVQGLNGPAGWRYQITTRSGDEWQISNDELLQLEAEHRLSVRGVKEIVRARVTR
jgi:hypothetical protein